MLITYSFPQADQRHYSIHDLYSLLPNFYTSQDSVQQFILKILDIKIHFGEGNCR